MTLSELWKNWCDRRRAERCARLRRDLKRTYLKEDIQLFLGRHITRLESIARRTAFYATVDGISDAELDRIVRCRKKKYF